MKKILALLLALYAAPAFGQAVQQSGFITPGHGVNWVANGVVGDSGAPSGGVGLLGSFVINDMLCSNATGTTISIIDCGFSATGTNNWVGLQNLNGGATAPTRSPGDSTANVATTAFVQAYNANLLSTPNTWTALQMFNGGAMIPETSTGVSARPSPVEVWPNNGFMGDNSKINYGIRYSISGAATLGTPMGGTAMAPVYITTPEATPFVSIVSSTSGANTDTGDNYNRTATLQMAQYGLQIGQGDFIQSYCYMELDAHLVGATNFIANPAITCLGGALAPDAAGAGGFINPINFVVVDNGFDIAAIMHSSSGARTVDTAALGEPWIGTLWQSIGTKAWDSFFSGAGKSKMGIDLTNLITNASGTWTKAAMVMNANDRIYMNGTAGTYYATATGLDFIVDNGTCIVTVVNNISAWEVCPTEVIATVPFVMTGSSSGVVTIQTQASAGTFNFNLPITAGAAGQPLLSGGGSTSPMTWAASTFPTNLLLSATAPVIGSCGGGSPAISANNGTAAFRVTVGSATSTCAITLPTATTGWNCYATDITQTTTTIFITKQTVSGTGGVTLGNFNDVASAANWGTSDVLAVSCFAL